MAKAALGKGLGALITPRVASPAPAPELGERVQLLDLGKIAPTPFQPRKEFRAEELQELTDSIRQHGIIQPLIVRKVGDGFEIIAGERRWRAAQQVGLSEVPVIVRAASDQEVLELALIENIQRANLNPIEEAQAFARLAREFNMKQEEIAQKVGKSRAAIANSMRLLELDEQVQSWLTQGRVSVGHAKVLLGIDSHAVQRALAEIVIRHNHTVRQTEKLVADHLAKNGDTRRAARKAANHEGSVLAPALQHLQNRLQQHLATRVALHHGEKHGHIEIEYYGNDDLQRILNILGLQSE